MVTTKYYIGDVVYRATALTTRKQHDCPDCLGTRKWSAKSPAGREYEMACPRCAGGYQSEGDLSLVYTSFVPHVERLTIGQVRTEVGRENKVSYMCNETGIGSGSVYNEHDLFPTETAAMDAAKLRATDSDKSVEWVAKLYDKTLSLSDFQLSDVTRDAAKTRFQSAHTKLGYLVDDIRDAISIEEIKDIIERFDEMKKLAAYNSAFALSISSRPIHAS